MKTPLIGIHEGLQHSFPDRSVRFEKILEYNSIPSLRINDSNPSFWEEIRKIDCLIYPFVHLDSEFQIARAILPVLENELEMLCFPDQKTCWHYDDKIKQYYLLKAHDFPIVKTWVFWDFVKASQWLETAKFPLVFKLKGGAGSTNVVLVKTRQEAVRLTQRMFKDKGVSFSKIPHVNNLAFMRNIFKLYGIRRWIAEKRGRLGPEGKNPYWQIHRDYVLFQEFLSGNTCDVRVTIIGDRAFAFRRHTRPNDFRASGSGLIDYDMSEIDTRCIRIGFDISEKMKFQCMAYDFIFDRDNMPRIAEISYIFLDTAVYNCPGFYDKKLQWYEGHLWPQFAILDMLFPELDLKQPPKSDMQL